MTSSFSLIWLVWFVLLCVFSAWIFWLVWRLYCMWMIASYFRRQRVPVVFQAIPPSTILYHLMVAFGVFHMIPERLSNFLAPVGYQLPERTQRVFVTHEERRRRLENSGRGNDVSCSPFLGRAFVVISPLTAILYLADPQLIGDIFQSRVSAITKHLSEYKALTFWGANLVVADGAIWKKQRIIANAAFNDATYQAVFENSRHFCNFYQHKWDQQMQTRNSTVGTSGGEGCEVNASEWGVHFALDVFCATSMGLDLHSNEEKMFRTLPNGKRVHMREVMVQVAAGIIKFTVLQSLGSRIRSLLCRLSDDVNGLCQHYELFSNELERMANADVTGQNHLLAKLVNSGKSVSASSSEPKVKDDGVMYVDSELQAESKANSELSQSKLSSAEIKSNIFVFLVAGHETTAHNIAFVTNLLAYNPGLQDFMYQEVCNGIRSNSPAAGDKLSYSAMTYQQLYLLPSIWAAVYETLRLLPVVPSIPKLTLTEVSLNFRDEKSGIDNKLTIPPQFVVTPHITSLSRSESVHAQASHFQPARWYKPEFKDSATGEILPSAQNLQMSDCLIPLSSRTKEFISFSQGSRQCLGARFALIEMVTVISSLIFHYRILPKSQKVNLHDTYTSVTMAAHPDVILELIPRNR